MQQTDDRSLKSEITVKLNNILNKNDLKKKQKIVHTKSVIDTINSYIPNKVLDQITPEINQKEGFFSRNSRVVLTQLRSLYSRKLNSYLHRIDEEIEDKCPDYNASPHDTNHLFNCQMRLIMARKLNSTVIILMFPDLKQNLNRRYTIHLLQSV